MSTWLGLGMAGLGGGAVLGALGIGLVLTNRASGVVNFAHAATGTFLALTFFEFRDRGDLALPIVGLPARVHLLGTPTLLTSLLVIVAYGAVLGAILHALVFRPLRSASSTSRLVATVGLFLYFQELSRMRFPTTGAAVVERFPVLPDGRVSVLGVGVAADRLWLALIVLVVAVVLAATYRWTRVGLASRAASESDVGALLTGLRPDLTAAANWAIATASAGLAVICIEPIAGLDPTTTGLLVVPALAAALIGRLRSFVVTALAGLAIGIVQSLLLGWAVTPGADWLPDWVPTTGLQQIVPVAVILSVLALRDDVRTAAAAVPRRRVRPAAAPRHALAGPLVIGAIALVGAVTLDAAGRRGLVVSATFAVLALSVVVVCGYVGRTSLAQLVLAGMSGFTVVRVAGVGAPFPLDLLCGVAVATVVGVAISLSVSRLRGMTFAVATLAIAVALEQLVLASPWWAEGGSRGAPRPSVLGIDLGASAPGAAGIRPAFVAMVVVVASACFAGVLTLRRSAVGLRWVAVRADETAAAAAGVDVPRTVRGAVAVSSALAGVSGALTAYGSTALSPASFTVFGSLVVVALVALGGISYASGAVIAALLVQGGLLTASGGSGGVAHLYAWVGVGLVVMAIVAPQGLAGLAAGSWDRTGRRRRRTAGSTGSTVPGGEALGSPA